MFRQIVLALSCAALAFGNGMNLGYGVNTGGVLPSGNIATSNAFDTFNNRTTEFASAYNRLFERWLEAWSNTEMSANGGDAGYYAMGQSQCDGFDKTFNVPLFDFIIGGMKGANKNSSDDFGGNSLCYYTCDGQCDSYKSMSNGAEVSGYPFGCICNQKEGQQRCDAAGPIANSKEFPATGAEIKCKDSPGCSNYCTSATNKTQPKGYLCNWVNAQGTLAIDPSLSLIKYCSCC
jgi:hypothetical protein